MWIALSPLQLRESLKNIRVESRLEGAESEEVSKLPFEEAEVSEQPLEGASGEGSEWKEHVLVLKGLGIGSILKCLWNWEVVRVQTMPKVSEVGVGRIPKCFQSGKQVIP